LFGRQAFGILLNAFIAKAGNGRKAWGFRIFLPLNPPPKGEVGKTFNFLKK
jgi:hypothetical protein